MKRKGRRYALLPSALLGFGCFREIRDFLDEMRQKVKLGIAHDACLARAMSIEKGRIGW
jgi:hypothetical protein